MAIPGSITRRGLFRGVPALALPCTLQPSSALHEAIARHSKADLAFSDNCWRGDTLDPRYASDTSENNERIYWATLKAEARTLDALLATPALTLEDSTAKGKHLLAYSMRDGMEARHFEPLLRAMIFDS